MKQTKRVPRWISPSNAITSKLAYAGEHVVADLWFGKIIQSEDKLRKLLLDAAKKANSKTLQISIHTFSPYGITGVVLLAESHIALHTWPEIGYTAVDIFTCGKNARPMAALQTLKEYIQPKRVDIRELKRGKRIV
jgi:S-adenosylmethionine decarboxylase